MEDGVVEAGEERFGGCPPAEMCRRSQAEFRLCCRHIGWLRITYPSSPPFSSLVYGMAGGGDYMERFLRAVPS